MTDTFTEWIAGWPGGKHVEAHMNEGPFYLVPATYSDEYRSARIPEAASRIRETYPTYRLPLWDGCEVTVSTWMHLPQFASEIASWYSDFDRDFAVFEENVTEVYDGELVRAYIEACDFELSDDEVDSWAEHLSLDKLVTEFAETTPATAANWTGQELLDTIRQLLV